MAYVKSNSKPNRSYRSRSQPRIQEGTMIIISAVFLLSMIFEVGTDAFSWIPGISMGNFALDTMANGSQMIILSYVASRMGGRVVGGGFGDKYNKNTNQNASMRVVPRNQNQITTGWKRNKK